MSISRSRLLSGIGLSLAFIATGTALAGYWCHRNQRISNRILTKVKRNFANKEPLKQVGSSYNRSPSMTIISVSKCIAAV